MWLCSQCFITNDNSLQTCQKCGNTIQPGKDVRRRSIAATFEKQLTADQPLQLQQNSKGFRRRSVAVNYEKIPPVDYSSHWHQNTEKSQTKQSVHNQHDVAETRANVFSNYPAIDAETRAKMFSNYPANSFSNENSEARINDRETRHQGEDACSDTYVKQSFLSDSEFNDDSGGRGTPARGQGQKKRKTAVQRAEALVKETQSTVTQPESEVIYTRKADDGPSDQNSKHVEELQRMKNVLVVTAIDFGTSYSGYAYSFCQEYKKDHNKIYIFTWDTGHDGCPKTFKTPTSILFDEDEKFHSFGYDAERNYAEMMEEKTHVGYRFFSQFKMQLYLAESNAERLMGQRRIGHKLKLKDAQNKSMSALKVFSESIKYFKNHFINCAKSSGFDLRMNDIHWILTIPAIWKDDAKQFMRKAATQAGIPNDLLSLTYEPEAAALYCKELSILDTDSQTRTIGKFESGDEFIILDCGGGTVDITCYRTMADSSLCELKSPTGGPWGGNTVNQEYFNLLKNLFGLDVWVAFQQNFPEDEYELKRSFEAKKTTVVKNSDKWINFRCPMSLMESVVTARQVTIKQFLEESPFSHSVKGDRDKMRFKNDFLEQCFTSSIEHIVNHLRLYLSKEKVKGIKTILMVGGFSECSILYNSIKHVFSNFNIIRPIDPMLAIVKGAVIFGNNPCLIRERICPRTYGISVNEPFNPTKHKDRAYFKVKIEGQEKCTDIFKPIVKKGQSILIGKSVFAVQCYPTRTTDLEATVEVYESSSQEPLYTFGDDVRKLGTIIIPIPDIARGKNRLITIQMHFGVTELYVTVKEEGTTNINSAKFDCLSA